jgi:hypothetical protein
MDVIELAGGADEGLTKLLVEVGHWNYYFKGLTINACSEYVMILF